MAFTVKIHGVPARDAHTGWMFDDIVWWRMQELQEKYPCREIQDETAYLDYVLVLTPTEAATWNRYFIESAQKDGLWQTKDWIARMQKLTDQMETTAGSLRWIVVERYEWESGF